MNENILNVVFENNKIINRFVTNDELNVLKCIDCEKYEFSKFWIIVIELNTNDDFVSRFEL